MTISALIHRDVLLHQVINKNHAGWLSRGWILPTNEALTFNAGKISTTSEALRIGSECTFDAAMLSARESKTDAEVRTIMSVSLATVVSLYGTAKTFS